MTSHVAFLRGMNLGRRRIRNDELCACFEAMGFGDVSAFLASGNVIFGAGRRAPKTLQKEIEAGLKKALEYDVPTFVRRAAEVHAIAEHEPFAAAELSGSSGKLQVALLLSAPGAGERRKALAQAQGLDDRLAFEGSELYWLPAAGVSDSELDLKALGRILGPMTVRTQRTLIRLAKKLEPGG